MSKFDKLISNLETSIKLINTVKEELEKDEPVPNAPILADRLFHAVRKEEVYINFEVALLQSEKNAQEEAQETEVADDSKAEVIEAEN